LIIFALDVRISTLQREGGQGGAKYVYRGRPGERKWGRPPDLPHSTIFKGQPCHYASKIHAYSYQRLVNIF